MNAVIRDRLRTVAMIREQISMRQDELTVLRIRCSKLQDEILMMTKQSSEIEKNAKQAPKRAKKAVAKIRKIYAKAQLESHKLAKSYRASCKKIGRRTSHDVTHSPDDTTGIQERSNRQYNLLYSDTEKELKRIYTEAHAHAMRVWAESDTGETFDEDVFLAERPTMELLGMHRRTRPPE